MAQTGSSTIPSRDSCSLSETLGIGKGSLVAIVGAGGKTSTMFHVARELVQKGIRPVATTTTRMSTREVPEDFNLILFHELDDHEVGSTEGSAEVSAEGSTEGSDAQDGVDGVKGIPLVVAGMENDKLLGLDESQMAMLQDRFDTVIAEADGARGRSFKVPRQHEPVVPNGATHLMIMVGLDALDAPVTGKSCFHPEDLAPQVGPGDELTPQYARGLLLSTRGYLAGKCVGGDHVGDGKTENTHICVLINKADDHARRTRAADAARWFYHPKVADVMISSLGHDGWCHRVENGTGAIWGIMLAAGEGRRSGGEKLLWSMPDGRSVVRTSVDNALEGGVDGLVVVLGHRYEEVLDSLGDLGGLGDRVVTVVNLDYASGMSSSLNAGMAALPREAFAAAVFLADQPMISPMITNAVMCSFQHSLARICRPRCGNQAGHPVVFRNDLFDEISNLKGDRGARSVVKLFGEWLLEVPWHDSLAFTDLDTRDDLDRITGF